MREQQATRLNDIMNSDYQKRATADAILERKIINQEINKIQADELQKQYCDKLDEIDVALANNIDVTNLNQELINIECELQKLGGDYLEKARYANLARENRKKYEKQDALKQQQSMDTSSNYKSPTENTARQPQTYSSIMDAFKENAKVGVDTVRKR